MIRILRSNIIDITGFFMLNLLFLPLYSSAEFKPPLTRPLSLLR
jgi:hypothetical protein